VHKLFWLFFLISGGALAAQLDSVTQQQQEQLLRDQQDKLQRQREQLQQRPDIVVPLPPPELRPATPLTNAVPACFPVQHISLEGVPSMWQGWFKEAVSAFQTRCVGMVEINELLARLGNILIGKGYITSRFYLPEQSLSSGELHLVLVPGVLGQLRDTDGKTDWALRSAFPLRPGDWLNVRDLEQGLEQLSRLPGQQASMEIMPGAVPGSSDVQVKREGARSFSGQWTIDNSGQEATGLHQQSVGLTFGGLAGLNDVLSLNRSQDADQFTAPRSVSNAVSWVVPWGNWSMLASYGEFSYQQIIQGDVQSFEASGLSRNASLGVTRLLRRDQQSKTDLRLSYYRKASRSYIEQVEIVQQKRDVSLFALDVLHRHYLGDAVLEATLSVDAGSVDMFRPPASEAWLPARHFTFYQAKLNLSSPFTLFGQRMGWQSEWKGQYSPDVLASTEQFSAGGSATVRGFQSNSLTGRNGSYWRNDLSHDLSFGPLSVQPFVGLDVGHVSGMTGTSASTHTLSGWAAGARLRLSHAYLEVVHEQPLHLPDDWSRQSVTRFSLSANW